MSQTAQTLLLLLFSNSKGQHELHIRAAATDIIAGVYR
jgi:hypothetical protein